MEKEVPRSERRKLLQILDIKRESRTEEVKSASDY